jgi:uncharacterized phage protein (TIGR02218 family)
MKTLPPQLNAKLEAGVTTLAQAWRLTRRDGQTVALTQHDRDLVFDGTTFSPGSPLLPAEHDGELTLAPDRTALSGVLNSDTITRDDLLLKRWDHARVEAFLVDWTDPSLFVAMWVGRVAGVNWQGQAFEFEIEGVEAALAREVGRVYARTCDARLGDARCGLDLSVNNRRLNGVILAVVSDRIVTIATPVGRQTSEFDGGRMRFATGALAGWDAPFGQIKEIGGIWRLELAKPLPLLPASGQSIVLEVGCDKTFATCRTRFANGLNFRGQPTLPGDDVAFGGPASSGNDGGKR